MEDRQVAGAIRTDLILSGEIMAIALAELSDQTILNQAVALAMVGAAITVGVYGVVALIVKMDDIGIALARRPGAGTQALGRGLVSAMPVVLSALGTIGTVAMLWVGGQIIIHGLHEFHLTPLPEWIEHAAEGARHALPGIGGMAEWIANAGLSAVFGIVIGGIIAGLLHLKPNKH